MKQMACNILVDLTLADLHCMQVLLENILAICKSFTKFVKNFPIQYFPKYGSAN